MTTKPNLLFLFTDEQATNTLAAYGNTQIRMPNLNRLAEDSVIFDNTYVTQPVCTPSRSTLLTGLYPHTNGCTENNVALPDEMPCFPELADWSEYRTAYYGKWHLGDEIFQQHGFDDWRSVEDEYGKYYSGKRDKSAHSTYHDFLLDAGFEPDRESADGHKTFSRGMAARLPEAFSKPAYIANEATQFIRDNTDRPFALWVNFLEPHMPFFSCRDDQYQPEDMPLPRNFYHVLDESNPLKTRLFREAYYEEGHSGLPLRSEVNWKRMIANYWGLNSLVDTHMGRIIHELEKQGLMDNTIIVYTSDHGDMMGSHRLLAKCTMFQEAVQVPFLLRIPGLASGGKHITAPVSQIDVIPTLLDAMGQSIPDTMQGNSLLPVLQGAAPAEENVFIEWSGLNNGFGDIVGQASVLDCWEKIASEEEIIAALGDPVRTVITPDGWKYNWSPLGESELYHIAVDPGETINLVKHPEQKERIAAMRQLIRGWQQRTGDAAELGED